MELNKVLERRHSVRDYADKDVEEERIEKILEAADSAPSAGGLDAYQVETIRNEELKTELKNAALDQDHVADAPVDLVFFQDGERSAEKYGERGRTLYSLQDATIAAAYSQLAATDQGVGSCWVGAFNEKKVRELLDSELRPVAIITLGYER